MRPKMGPPEPPPAGPPTGSGGRQPPGNIPVCSLNITVNSMRQLRVIKNCLFVLVNQNFASWSEHWADH